MNLLCPRCGAKNTDTSERCYACAAPLHTKPNEVFNDIPDELLAHAEEEVRNAPVEPPEAIDRQHRIAIAVAVTLASIILLYGFGWIFLILALLGMAFFPFGLVFIIALPMAFIMLWSWALRKDTH